MDASESKVEVAGKEDKDDVDGCDGAVADGDVNDAGGIIKDAEGLD